MKTLYPRYSHFILRTQETDGLHWVECPTSVSLSRIRIRDLELIVGYTFEEKEGVYKRSRITGGMYPSIRTLGKDVLRWWLNYIESKD